MTARKYLTARKDLTTKGKSGTVKSGNLITKGESGKEKRKGGAIRNMIIITRSGTCPIWNGSAYILNGSVAITNFTAPIITTAPITNFTAAVTNANGKN